MTTTVIVSLMSGLALAHANARTMLFLELLVLLAAFVILSRWPEWTFAGWLFIAPFLQVGAAGPAIGQHLSTALYLAPTAMFIAWCLLSARSRHAVPSVDLFPAAFVLFAVLSVLLDSQPGTSRGALLDQLYRNVGIGVIAYYYCAWGPAESPWTRLAQVLLGSASVISGMALVEKVTGWTLWGDSGWHAGVFRVVGPLANPDVLGTVLGAAIAMATAVLLWNGPRTLRRLSSVTLVVASPALFLTYTRAPIVATALIIVIQVAFRRRVRAIAVGVLAIAVTAVVAAWGSIATSAVYQQRAADTKNVYGRILLTDWSLQLAGKHPLSGAGYGSFDRVKRSADLPSGGLDPAAGLDYTSHNTFLTVLVELGAVGVALLVWPWLRVMWTALRGAHHDPSRRWVFAGWLGVIVVYAVNASTIDMRFFSFVAALPWIALGVLRRAAFPPRPTP